MQSNFNSELFASFGANVTHQQPTTAATPAAPAPQQAPSGPVKDTFENKTDDKKPKNKVLDYILKYSGVAALVATPISLVTMHKLNKSNVEKISKQIEKQFEQVSANNSAIGDKVSKLEKGTKGLWGALAAFVGGIGIDEYLSKNPQGEDSYSKEMSAKLQEKSANINNDTQEAKNIANDAKDTANYAQVSNTKGALHAKYVENVDGFNLLKGVDKKAGFNQTKYDAAVKQIQNAATDLLNGNVQEQKAPLKKGDTVWSVTSEFAPIKEGGLGSVPVELQKNFESLGIKTPTFIPMYQKNGFAALKQENGKYTYNYSGTVFNLDKVAQFKVHSYKSDGSKDEPVEVFVSNSKIVKGKEVKTAPLVFIKNDEYFNGSIYSKSAKAEEPEKFAFFDKAVYEFAKAKLDPNSVKGLQICDNEKYNEIAAPKGLMLNDWQASAIAALSRYKAPMENAYGGIKDDAAKTLSDMRIMTIGHNAQYQGLTDIDNDYGQKVEVSENILNTLFDNFAADIAKNAKTGAPYESLSNSLIMNPDSSDRHVNLLNMGVCLSDYFAPVSKNYAKELVDDPEKAHYLQWALEQKDKSGTLVGIINGNDLENISIEKSKADTKDKIGVDLVTYNQNSSKDEVLKARLQNKKSFLNDFAKPFANNELKVDRLENVGNTKLPEMSDEELDQTPVFSYAHRLVDQKGVDIVADSIKKTYDNWDKDFHNKPKPIFYLGGEDGEGGAKRALIEKLKKDLKPEDSNRVVFAHGFTPAKAFMACTDYFLMPSKFEPCGLTQSESFAQGTPVIATATGGIVDTVEADGAGQTGILTDDISADGFYKGIKEGVNTFFNDREKYNDMVMNAVKQDFSWIQPDRQGPIYDYLDKFGIDRNTLPDKSELTK